MAILRFKRATAARWQELNPLLLSGEPGYEKDTGQLKIGDGVLYWNDLSYLSGEGGSPIVLENIDDRVNELLVAGNGIDLNYDDEEDTLTITNTKPIVAPQWTVNHTLADGTRYLAGDVVWDNGNIFVAKFDNESLPTNNTTYWQNLGSGNRLNIDGRDIPNISNPFDQNLNTIDFPTFSGVNLSNNSTLAPGTYDSGYGGNNGISLNCVVGYELNWQAGRLKNTYNNGEVTASIYFDSPITYAPTVVSLSFFTTIAVDAKAGEIFDIILTDNLLLDNPINAIDGKTIRFRITQDNTGGRTVTFGTKFTIPSSASSPLPWSTAANKTDLLAATYHAGRDKWDIIAFVPGY